jgi:hypothetical protein
MSAAVPKKDVSDVSPHCAKRWPQSCINNYDLANVRQALCGISTIAHLLHSDTAIRESINESDDDPDLPRPFSIPTVFGLVNALEICVHFADLSAEKLEGSVR